MDRGLLAVAYNPWINNLFIIYSKKITKTRRKPPVPRSYFESAKSALASNLKLLRSERGLAQERLGFDAEVDRTLVSKIEREVANPTLDVLIRLAFCLEVPLKRLFDGAEKADDSLGGGATGEGLES